MKIDEWGVLVSEIYTVQNGEGNDYFYAGDRADSMATTSRWIDLLAHLNMPHDITLLNNFGTESGYQSHPSPRMPANLKETSISSDSLLPYFLVGYCPNTVKYRIKRDGWKTGNGNLVEPMFFAALVDSVFLVSVFVLIQALIFRIPWRWDDGQRKFVSSGSSSCDYLNWFHVALRCPRWVRRSVNEKVLWQKFCDYYKPEPNVNWFLAIYDQTLMRYWL